MVWPLGMRVVKRGLALPILRNNGLFFAATACVGFANYLLNTTAARRLVAGDYSQFGIMLNLLAAFAPVSAAVGTAVTRRAIANRAYGDTSQTDTIQRMLVRQWSFVCIGGLIVVVLVHTWIGHFLRLTATTPLYFVVLTGYWLVVQGLLQSVLQERGRYGRLSAIFLGEGVFRGLLGVLAIIVGFGITGALVVYTASAVCAACFFPRPARLWTGARAAQPAMRPMYRDIGRLMLANLSLIVLSNLDIVLCRRFLSPETADKYVAIASLAKFFLFATASISAIAFSETVKAVHQGGASARPLLVSFGLVTILGVAFVAFCGALGTHIIAFAFGSAYRTSGHALWLTAASAFAVSIITLEITFFNARNRFWYLPFLLLACAAIIGALPLANGHLQNYAAVYAVGTTGIAVALTLPLGLGLRSGTLQKGLASAPNSPRAASMEDEESVTIATK